MENMGPRWRAVSQEGPRWRMGDHEGESGMVMEKEEP